MKHPSHVTRRALLANLALPALTACSGLALATSRANSAAIPDVRIVTTQGVTGLTLQEIVRSQHYMDKFGVQADTVNVSDASKAVAALLSGVADICMWSGLNSVLSAIEKGAQLKLVGGALLSPTQLVFSSHPNIRFVRDLKGKTIGVGALGSQLHLVMLALLRKKGVDPSTVTFRNVGSSADIFRAVAAGTVDAGPSEVALLELQKKFSVHPIEDGYLWKEVPEFTFQAAYAATSSIAGKREALTRALAAYGKVYRFVQDPSSQSAFVTAQMIASGHKDEAEALRQWQFVQTNKPYDVNLVLSPESVNFMQQLNLEVGMQRRILPFENVADMSLAKAALNLLEHN